MPARAHDESGSVLVMAMMLLVVAGLGLAALLTYTQAGFQSGAAHRDARDRDYTAEGAVELGLARLGENVCDPWQEVELNGVAASISCRAPGTPPWALVALGADPTEGGVLVAEDSGDVHLAGNLLAASGVRNAGSGVLHVAGVLQAGGACEGAIEAAELACDDPAPGAVDPGYLVAQPTDLAHQPTPACPEEGWLVALEPGFHSDAAALSALTDGACPGAVLWFQPGLHYLNFTFVEPYLDCDAEDRPCTWTVTDPTVSIVAGTPRGWDPEQEDAPRLAVPGSCDRGRAGVRLVAGGASRIDVGAGRFELCPDPTFADPQIAVHALPTAESATGAQGNGAAQVVVGDGFDHPLHALVIGEEPEPLLATAALDRTDGPVTATLTFTAFAPADGIPRGARLDTVLLHVAHRHDGDLDSLTVTIDPGDGDPIVLVAGDCATPDPAEPPPLCLDTDLHTDTVDLTAELHARGLDTVEALEALTVTYTATVAEEPGEGEGATATVDVDGLALSLHVSPPVPLLPGEAAGDAFDDPEHALVIGEDPDPLVATAALDRTDGPVTAALTLTAFAPADGIPPGARLDTVLLHVAHRHDGDLDSLTVTIDPGAGDPIVLVAGTGCPRAGQLCLDDDLHTDTVDLTAGLHARGLDTVETLDDLSITYTATVAGQDATTATVDVDGLALSLHVSPPVPLLPGEADGDGFDDPEHALVIGEDPEPLLATAALDRTDGPATAGLAFTAFAPAETVPPESRLDTVLLHVAHRHDGDLEDLTVTLRPSGADPILLTAGDCANPPDPAEPPPLCLGPDLHTDNVDLTAEFHARGLDTVEALDGLTVTYVATVAEEPGQGEGATATVGVDGLALSLHHVPPVTGDEASGAARAVVGDGFDRPEHALVIGEEPEPLLATARLDPVDGPVRATLTFTAFAPADDIPPGARLEAALLHVAHRHDGELDSLTVTIEPGDGDPIVLVAGQCEEEPPDPEAEQPDLCLDGDLHTDVVDLVPALTDRGLARLDVLGDLRVTYAATVALVDGPPDELPPDEPAPIELPIDLDGATVAVDGLALALHFTAPAFEPLAGCAAVAPFPQEASCAFLRLASAETVLHGMVYAPTAAVDIDVPSPASPLLRGAVVRHLRLRVATGPDPVPVIAVPPPSGHAEHLELVACLDGLPAALVRVRPPTRIAAWLVTAPEGTTCR
jgi:hypothetical protein